MWEQYIRDLAVFGTNAIELIPPRSDDDADSPHFPLPPMRDDDRDVAASPTSTGWTSGSGIRRWTRTTRDPAHGRVRARRSGARSSRSCRGSTPSSSPAATRAHAARRYLFALLEKQTANLRRYHPEAQMWVSPQGFNAEWMDEFSRLHASRAGVAGRRRLRPAGARSACPSCARRVPARYPIRHYPDITHSLQCQYPVPDWDLAYALTEGREPINPRPLDQAHDLPLPQPHTHRLHHLSEGCNDDVNKIVWSGLGWDPEATGHRHPAASTAAISSAQRTPTPSPRGCWRWSGTGRARCSTNDGVVHHAAAVPGRWNAAPPPDLRPTGGSSRPSIGPTTTPTCEPADRRDDARGAAPWSALRQARDDRLARAIDQAEAILDRARRRAARQ